MATLDSSIEVREYWVACDQLFLSGVDTPEDTQRIRHHNYHNAWLRLLAAGYTPDEAMRLRR